MVLFKLIPVLLTFVLLCNRIMARELPAERVKRSLTTICLEIKPSGPQEEPYYMCKGTDLPPLLPPRDSAASYKLKNPSYGGGNFQNPSPTYNAQYQDSKSETYEKQPADGNQNNGPGYGGFRRPATQAAAPSYQPATNSPAQQADTAKQQFFPKPSEYQTQQQQFKSSPPSQPAVSYGFSNGNQQPDSYAPSNSPYVSESGATQAQQSAYSESSGGSASRGGGGGRAFARPQPSAASYGSGTKQHSTNGASGSFAKPSFSESLPATSTSTASFGQTLPYANAAAASPDVEEHGYSKEASSSAFMVPAAQKPSTANIKTKNAAASLYVANEQPKSSQNSYGANADNGGAAALLQSNPSKTASANLNDYRAMLSEDIFQSPIWGFSPDEFASFRSISEEVEQPLYTPNAARSQHADSYLRHMPPEYRDDPVMRQFYKSLHEPMTVVNPLGNMPIRAQPAYKSKVAKVPTSNVARPQVSAPQPQRAPPQVKQTDAINSKALCETASPPPPPTRQQTQQCSPEAIAGSPYAPPARLTPSSNCEPCSRRDYNFQPVFIAVPCYSNGGATAYLNLGVPGAQSSYPNPMNQYASSLPGEAALYANQRASAFPGFGPSFAMPYVAPMLGSSSPFAFYNNPQYAATSRASSAEETSDKQTMNKPKPTTVKPASQESTLAAKSTDTTNNEFTMNTSMETAETKATQPTETSTSVAEVTTTTIVPEIPNKPPTNARTNESSQEQLVGIGTDAVNNQEPTTEAIPMGKQTKKTYDTIMSMAQEYSKIHYDESLAHYFDDDEEDDKSQVKRTAKGKRQNAKQQGAAYKRQNAPAI